jgi:pyruvate dehydrogenase E1 component beta subunit
MITYAEAIRQATRQEMALDANVILLGLGVDDERGLIGTTLGLIDEFGPDRVIDTPLAEDGMTGIAIGMSMNGLRPIHVHVRMEFLLLAFNQIINIASKAHYMYGGNVTIPIVVRALIGDGWGSQHSQGLHSLLAHIPGLKVVAPGTPYAAKGCLVSAIRDDNPVIFIEHFNLYATQGDVASESYTLPLNKGHIERSGNDITLLSIAGSMPLGLKVTNMLAEHGISAELIDVISLSDLDMTLILTSAAKTKNVLIIDTAWLHLRLISRNNCQNI